jgi:hypothetical protein
MAGRIDTLRHATGIKPHRCPPRHLVHWNGTACKQVASPSPGASGTRNVLQGVAAVSSSDAWAVGYYQHVAPGSAYTLMERWNGTDWQQVASP